MVHHLLLLCLFQEHHAENKERTLKETLEVN